MLRRGISSLLKASKENFSNLARRVSSNTNFTSTQFPLSRKIALSGSTLLTTGILIASKQPQPVTPVLTHEALLQELNQISRKRDYLYAQGAAQVAALLGNDFNRLVEVLRLFKTKYRSESTLSPEQSNSKLAVLSLLQDQLPNLVNNSYQLGVLVRLITEDDFKGDSVLALVHLLKKEHLQCLLPNLAALNECLSYALYKRDDVKIAVLDRLGGMEYLTQLVKTREDFTALSDALPTSSRRALAQHFKNQEALAEAALAGANSKAPSYSVRR